MGAPTIFLSELELACALCARFMRALARNYRLILVLRPAHCSPRLARPRKSRLAPPIDVSLTPGPCQLTAINPRNHDQLHSRSLNLHKRHPLLRARILSLAGLGSSRGGKPVVPAAEGEAKGSFGKPYATNLAGSYARTQDTDRDSCTRKNARR